MELSIVEWVVVQAMRGNGGTVRELLDNLGNDEKEELVNELLHMPLKAKIILRKLGYDEMDVYQVEEEYFENVEELKKLLKTGE